MGSNNTAPVLVTLVGHAVQQLHRQQSITTQLLTADSALLVSLTSPVAHACIHTGFLDRLAFHKAMDLISIAQQGKEITRCEAQAHTRQPHRPCSPGCMQPAQFDPSLPAC